MAGNESSVINGVKELIKAADEEQAASLQEVESTQQLFIGELHRLSYLLGQLETQRSRFPAEQTISLEQEATIQEQLAQLKKNIPALIAAGVITSKEDIFPEGIDLGEIDAQALARLEDHLSILKDLIGNKMSHLTDGMWQQHHDHAMKMATLSGIDHNEVARTVNNHLSRTV